MDTAAPKDHLTLRRLGVPMLIQRQPSLFRIASYLRAGNSNGQVRRLVHLACCIRRERNLLVGDFAHSTAMPRFIGALTGRSGTTWVERIFRHSFNQHLETIGERHLFWLHPFRVAPREFHESSDRSQYFNEFRTTMLTYAYRTRFEDGRITYGGLARLLPHKALQLALDQLEIRLEHAGDTTAVYREFGNFYQWLLNCWSYCASGQRKEWISKEPSYGKDCDHLFRLIPNAKLLVLTRDGRDVALSFVSAGWAPDFSSGVGAWKQSAAQTLQKLSTIPRKQWLLIKFEDLVEHFESQTKKICDFFELPVPNTEIGPKPVSQRVGGWNAKLSNEEKSMFAYECSELMERLGY